MNQTATARPVSKEELLEDALLQQLHPVIYSTLQILYHEKYPAMDHERIVRIASYLTGFRPDRQASALGGAKVFQIIVEVRAVRHHQVVRMVLNNERGANLYSVSEIKQMNIRD
ncbi:hypothetical protein [Cohnella xylanilytica]|uniref:hypothetical protein n=1 Tax=Cohnella xylanilytica TaxID=557555 RepID=UPI001BB31D15|nr:hypothetical protein [Cohnella xylanilytica]